jgi:SAM-dependent methyltransferase
LAHGIPAIMAHEEIHPLSHYFLGWDEKKPETTNPYPVRNISKIRLLIAEFLYFIIACTIWLKNPKKLFQRWYQWIWGSDYSIDVKKALYYGWNNYYNLILKSGERNAFNQMSPYITEPSLEIGCGSCQTTNLIFRDTNTVTFGCEYFMNTYLTSPDEMYKVVSHYIGGSIKSLPFSSDVFQSIYMVHIIDHISLLDTWFREIHRIIKPGGYLVIDTYSKNIFELLPGVQLRSKISKKWANNYKLWRISKNNPYRGGIPLKSDNEYYATGQNLFSLEEWSQIGEKYGFVLVDHRFFTNSRFSMFMDIEYRGYYPSILSSIPIYFAIDEDILSEKNSPLSEENAGNVILVFQKK